MSRWINTYSFTIKKTASYYVTHIMVAAMVAYTVTGDLVTAVTLSSLEPTVQAVVFFFSSDCGNRLHLLKIALLYRLKLRPPDGYL